VTVPRSSENESIATPGGLFSDVPLASPSDSCREASSAIAGTGAGAGGTAAATAGVAGTTVLPKINPWFGAGAGTGAGGGSTAPATAGVAGTTVPPKIEMWLGAGAGTGGAAEDWDR
jgi:hypothetical protein